MGNLIVIFCFVLLAASMVLAFAREAHRRSIAHEERKLELLARTEEAKRGTGGDTHRKLEERVRVLERLATENRSDLAAQIEQLRDLDLIEDRVSHRETAQ